MSSMSMFAYNPRTKETEFAGRRQHPNGLVYTISAAQFKAMRDAMIDSGDIPEAPSHIEAVVAIKNELQRSLRGTIEHLIIK